MVPVICLNPLLNHGFLGLFNMILQEPATKIETCFQDGTDDYFHTISIYVQGFQVFYLDLEVSQNGGATKFSNQSTPRTAPYAMTPGAR